MENCVFYGRILNSSFKFLIEIIILPVKHHIEENIGQTRKKIKSLYFLLIIFEKKIIRIK